uniref:Casein kinase II subunit beta n=1 Tax=Blastobotrys adeninivorans TaxID=409370 RepID=A0A060TJ45_BLAAD
MSKSESGSSVESLGGDTWVSAYCSMVGHEYFCEVLDEFIDDDFNLTGLGQMVPHYREALELISDLEPSEQVKVPNIPQIEQSAELLYGLIHARFILSRPGLQIMAQKYECLHFGVCPRYNCDQTGLLPMGRHDLPGYETVRLYCPCCTDIYHPPNSRYLNIDGAFFGTSFPGLFLQTFPDIEQRAARKRAKQFELKIYGFKISELSKAGPRMKWLRQVPQTDEEVEEMESDAYLHRKLENKSKTQDEGEEEE